MLQDNVREANRDAQLWRQVCELVLDKNLVDRVWQRSEYDPREDKWILPEMLRAKRQYQDLSCPPLPGMGPTPPVEGGVFARPASRSPRAVMGLAGAARPPVAAARRGGPAGAATSIARRLDDFMDAPRESTAAFLERDPVAASSSRPGSTRPHSRPLSRAGGSRGGDPEQRTAERSAKSRRLCGSRARLSAGSAAAAGRPPGRPGRRPRGRGVEAAVPKAAAAEEEGAGGLAGAAVGGLAGAAATGRRRPARRREPRLRHASPR